MDFKIKAFENISLSMINWCNNWMSQVSDFNIGSRIRTIIEAVALELEELYWRVYTSMNDSQSNGIYDAFNFSIRPASKATGVCTFSKNITDPIDSVTRKIPVGTLISNTGTQTDGDKLYETIEYAEISLTSTQTVIHLYDNTLTLYYTDHKDVFEVVSVIATIGGNAVELTADTDYETVPAINQFNFGINILINTITNESDLIINYKARSVDVAVRALTPGVGGNISANNITTIKSGLTGIENVNNYSDINNGLPEENKEDRAARFSQYIGSLSRGTYSAIKYAIFNKVFNYKVYVAKIFEGNPLPGYLSIFVGDASGLASPDMITEVSKAVEEYKGAGVVALVYSTTPLYVDVATHLKIRQGYDRELVKRYVLYALNDHLNSYGLDSETGFKSCYLSNLDMIIMNTRPEAIIEADISFKRRDAEQWGNPSFPLDPAYPRKIDDIIPLEEIYSVEVIRAGTITVTYE